MASAPAPWFPIRTARLLLREFEARDRDDVHEYASDPETVRYMDWGPNTPEVTDERLRALLAEQRKWPRPEVNLAVEASDIRKVIGSVRIRLGPQRSADFGYVLGRRWWRVGYGYEATSALLQTAFARLDVHRAWASCDVRNTASLRLLEKLGMRCEGTLRRDRLVRDGWRDTHLYVVLEEECRR